MTAKTVSRTIACGEQRWRISASGTWSALFFGTFADKPGVPMWRWQSVETSRVPKEVLKEANKRN